MLNLCVSDNYCNSIEVKMLIWILNRAATYLSDLHKRMSIWPDNMSLLEKQQQLQRLQKMSKTRGGQEKRFCDGYLREKMVDSQL